MKEVSKGLILKKVTEGFIDAEFIRCNQNLDFAQIFVCVLLWFLEYQ